MTKSDRAKSPADVEDSAPRPRRSLLKKYIVSFVAVVVMPLAGYTVVGVWFAAEEHRAALAELQRVQAESTAFRITQFIRQTEDQLRWIAHLSWMENDPEQYRMEAVRLLRLAPAISDVTLIDGTGHERLFMSRMSMDRVNTRMDRTRDPHVLAALKSGIHYSPVYFRRDSEPFFTIALAGSRREAGVVLAEINLKYIRDVVARVRIGRQGQAYVVDQTGRLIAHPDASLVLRNTDLSHLVRTIDSQPEESLHAVQGSRGEPVLVAQALATPLEWRVLVELPESEAEEPWHRALQRSMWVTAVSLAVALGFAVVFAWRMVRPVRLLTAGAARIASGQLGHRIHVNTADEIEQLGNRFNHMAGELERSYATLERKVDERTRELTEANQSKSRFLAAASHDLRQPLHALNLLVAQLRSDGSAAERERLTRHIEGTVGSINALFDGLLDISKLDAGVVAVNVTEFPIQPLLQRIEAAFAQDAVSKGLRLHVRAHTGWVRSDAVLLERVLFNLVGNALRYTRQGGVLVRCRRLRGSLRLEVWDTGIGISPDKHEAIFGEFYQVAPSGTLRGEGLGLGLAIVARLCRLLDHQVELASTPGRGSRFCVRVPEAPAQVIVPPVASPDIDTANSLNGTRVLVIDNDPDVLESAAGLLRTWGCTVITASSFRAAVISPDIQAPGLLITDIHLDDGEDGVESAIRLRRHFGRDIPVILVSGDVSKATRERVAASGFPLLEKPVSALRLRTLTTRLLRAVTDPMAGPNPVV
jgi:signal transduction histidine kinase/CheY-like chemotaxis protein